MPAPPTAAGTPTPLVLKNQTEASLSGDLASREFRSSHSPLSAVTGTDVLAPTILDLVVSPGGAVILTRLVSTSGQRDADAMAVDWARSLQFAATGVDPSPAASDPAQWMTGQLVVHWRVEQGLR
ncbi:MAG TPA: hypothetical protein DCE44_04705 [Verrucomicrobiales bacterium]|nr:hypothetical protein [Verrucomicrobiales bacterium]